ncbi:MAG: ZIP family metal transporter [Gammaproteobacteria bacterium]|nr:MAG: ZIP family metal transporter [Gammaproteobacteria bacterium]
MNLLFLIIIFSVLGGVLSVLAASAYLLLSEEARSKLMPHLVSFATGSLLGTAFLTLLPHAMEGAGITSVHNITTTVLLGIMGFFLLEKMVLWRHCHHEECEVHGTEHDHDHEPTKPAGMMILIGDGMHNFVDGILIAAAFMTDVHVGIVVSLAVAAHEIPQEVGDFAILLHSGYSRSKALLYNILASLTTVVGGVLAYYSLASMELAIPYVLAVAAASFIYIAVADLIPTLHQRSEIRVTIQQILLISSGVIIIYITHSSLH